MADTKQVLEQLIYLLGRLRETWKNELRIYPNLKSRDLDVLSYVYYSKNLITMQDLANYLKVSPAAITQMVASYEKKGILKKVQSEVDHRMNHIVIHPDLAQKIEEQHQKLEDQVGRFIVFTNDMYALEELLEKLIEFYDAEHGKNES